MNLRKYTTACLPKWWLGRCVAGGITKRQQEYLLATSGEASATRSRAALCFSTAPPQRPLLQTTSLWIIHSTHIVTLTGTFIDKAKHLLFRTYKGYCHRWNSAALHAKCRNRTLENPNMLTEWYYLTSLNMNVEWKVQQIVQIVQLFRRFSAKLLSLSRWECGGFQKFSSPLPHAIKWLNTFSTSTPEHWCGPASVSFILDDTEFRKAWSGIVG